MKYIKIILFIIPITVFGQNLTTEKSYSSWNSIIVDYAINNKVYIKNEAHFRRTSFLKEWQQILIRPSIHYKSNETLDFAVGYSFAKNYKPTHNFNENNVWEQVTLSHMSGKSNFKHRFRFEQRFIDQVTEVTPNVFKTNETDFKMRFRYRFTFQIPLFTVYGNTKVKGVVFDEIWLNTDSGIVPKSLNQNWFYVGLSYPILKNTFIGLGYMNDYVSTTTNHFRNNHILQTTLKFHI
ncbi:DUF2490 domain-containing protein [Aquimarina macrocephali]|uniref:DUF2490 domain-containing protein n=1 Tax=Aquimarina macrocephali TaxID=666563 RepID=UPI003F672C34